MSCYAAVNPYKYSCGSFLFYSLHFIHCLPKVGLHALYMVNSVLFSSEGKGLRKNSLNVEQTIYFNFVEDILFFSLPYVNKLFFSKKSQPPPQNIKWSVPKLLKHSLKSEEFTY